MFVVVDLTVCNIRKGIAYWGADFKNLKTTSAITCCKECSSAFGCWYWTYDLYTRQCFLKWKNGTGNIVEHEKWVSGTPVKPVLDILESRYRAVEFSIYCILILEVAALF